MAQKNLTYVWPYRVRPKVNDPFGVWREGNGGRWHLGVDFDAHDDNKTADILASTNGKVSFAGWQDPNDTSAGAGLYVKITHTNDGFESFYMHLSAITVSVGDTVIAGQKIGSQGSTGSSTGPHLHFEIRYKGVGSVSSTNRNIGSPENKPLSEFPVIDPIYLLTNGAESSPGITTNRPDPTYSFSVGYVGGQEESTFDLNVGGTKLLNPSGDERKYGLSVFDTTQPLIRSTTAEGVTGASTNDAISALKQYSKYIYYYLNSNMSQANLQVVSMPWIRIGFNIWVDPLFVDKVYYVNSVSHTGSASGGVYTSLGLSFARDRKKFTNQEYTFGSLKPGVSDNVFVNTIDVPPDNFSKAIVGSAADFENIKARAESFYSGMEGDTQISLYNEYYQYLYNTIKTEAGTVIGTSQSPIIGQRVKEEDEPQKTTPTSITEPNRVVIGAVVKISGQVYNDQNGSKVNLVANDKGGRITYVGNLSSLYPYHFELDGYVSLEQITVLTSPIDNISITNQQSTSPAATGEFSGVEDIQKWINEQYASPPQVIQDRIAKHKKIFEKADKYIATHYSKG